MFLNPETTGLIVLGASEYEREQSHTRQVYLEAKESIIEYFQNTAYGLGLDSKSVADLFNLNEPVQSIAGKVTAFIGGTRLEDLFIYICTHGFHDDNERVLYEEGSPEPPHLYLLLSQSRTTNVRSCLDFEALVTVIRRSFTGRAYYILDCCCSGVVHEAGPYQRPDGDEPPRQIAGVKTFPPPETGEAFLTANNRLNPGEVVARDDLAEILSTPLFTHALLAVLRNGARDPASPFLSIEQLCRDIGERLPEAIERVNQHVNNHEPINDEFSSMRPDCSSRMIANDAPLSRVEVFPNNGDDRNAQVQAFRRMLAIVATYRARVRDAAREREESDRKGTERVQSLTAENTALKTRVKKLRRLVWMAPVAVLTLLGILAALGVLLAIVMGWSVGFNVGAVRGYY